MQLINKLPMGYFVNGLTTTILCTDKQNLDVNKKCTPLCVLFDDFPSTKDCLC